MKIEKNVPLAKYTTFKTGGPAEYFCEVSSKEDLTECFKWTKQNKLGFFFLGNGSNLLINDAGLRGAVIKLANSRVSWENNRSTAEAGIILASLIKEAKCRGLGGMEWAFGIPATLGGAVRNNAGAYGSDIARMIDLVEVFDTEKSEFSLLKKQDCDFSYHKSVFQQKSGWLIWAAALRWEEKSQKAIEALIQKYIKLRKEKQPLESPSAGSFFRNPSLSSLDEDKKEKLIEEFIKKELARAEKTQDKEALSTGLRERINQAGTLPAAHLIEECGLKGRKIGGAQVSNKHANFIINAGKATTEDVVILASIIKQKVRTQFEIQLYEEVEYVGF